MANKLGSSRLLVKIATGIDTYGEKGFEQKLDTILDYKPNNGERIINGSATNRNIIVDIVATSMSLTAKQVKRGTNSENEKFAMALCVYFMKIKIRYTHKKISEFFKRESHTFVTDSLGYIKDFNKNPTVHAKKVEVIKKISDLIDKELK